MFFQQDHSEDWSRNDNDELWRAFQQGERRALAELFVRFYPRLFRYGVTLISDQEEVKDGIQELFLRLWRNRRGLEEAGAVDVYLIVSFRRLLFREKKGTHARRERNRDYIGLEDRPELSAEKKIIRLEIKEERYRLYRKALQSLTQRESEVLQLRMEYGLDNREIAAVLELSEKRVRNLIYETTKKLKAWVERADTVRIKID